MLKQIKDTKYWISDIGEVFIKRGDEFVPKASYVSKGYKRTQLTHKGESKQYLVHRLVYETFKEEDISELCIDHIDGNRQNNSLENLRTCTQLENKRFNNRKNLANSGYVGINKRGNSYRVYYSEDYKQIHVGSYSSLDDAIKARDEARLKTRVIEKVFCLSDIHIPYHDEEVLEKVFEIIKEEKPDEIILNGNINDCNAFSTHPKKKEVAMRFRTAIQERETWFPVAKKLREVAGDKCKIIYVGSQCHEGRIPIWAALSDILIDNPEYEIQNWFKLSDYNIEFAPEFYSKNGFIFTHGTIARAESGGSAKCEFGMWNSNGASGHCHRLASYYKTTRGITQVWFETGCLCQRQAWYNLKGRTSYMNWMQGFLYMNFENEVFSGQLIPVLRNSKDKPMIFFNGVKY